MSLLLKKFSDVYKDVDYYSFYHSQWQHPNDVSYVYLCYRWIVFLMTLIVAACCIFATNPVQAAAHWSDYAKWFIYATNWGYLAIVIQAMMSLYLVQSKAFARGKHCAGGNGKGAVKLDYQPAKSIDDIDTHETHGKDRVYGIGYDERKILLAYRIIYTVAFDNAFVISALFWSVLYDQDERIGETLNLLVHLGNVLLMLLEASVVAHVAEWQDVTAPLCVGLTFLGFSGIYHLAGGTNMRQQPYIYPFMDWTKPMTTISFAGAGVIGTLISHTTLMLLQAARRSLFIRWQKSACKQFENLNGKDSASGKEDRN